MRVLGLSGVQAESEAPELVEGCLLWEQESNWTGCRYWKGTARGGSFGAGTEVEEVEVVVEGRV